MLTHLGAFPKGREYQAGEGFPGQVLRMEFLLLVRDGEHFQVGLFVLFFFPGFLLHILCLLMRGWKEESETNEASQTRVLVVISLGSAISLGIIPPRGDFQALWRRRWPSLVTYY